jgi:Metal-dependent hydrolases of the beta-lactamase superfamily III
MFAVKSNCLALIASCLLCSTAVGADRPEKPAVAGAGVKLYTLDCGHMEFKDMGIFADTGEYDGAAGKLTAACFVIKHPKGTLLWDSGLGDKIAETPQGIDLLGGQIHFSVPLTVASQLKEIGLAPADVTYVSFSHLHLDHAGNANMFPSSHGFSIRARLPGPRRRHRRSAWIRRCSAATRR